MTLVWTNGEVQEEKDSMIVNMKIQGTDDTQYLLKEIRTMNELKLPSQSVDLKEITDKYCHFKGINMKSYHEATPTLLLGLPYAYLYRSQEERTGKFNEPMAKRTPLGWIIYGSCGNYYNSKKKHLLVIDQKPKEDDKSAMRKMMHDYFSVEEYSLKSSKRALVSAATARAQKIMEVL